MQLPGSPLGYWPMTACAVSWIPTGILTHDRQCSFLDAMEDSPHPIVDYQLALWILTRVLVLGC